MQYYCVLISDVFKEMFVGQFVMLFNWPDRPLSTLRHVATATLLQPSLASCTSPCRTCNAQALLQEALPPLAEGFRLAVSDRIAASFGSVGLVVDDVGDCCALLFRVQHFLWQHVACTVGVRWRCSRWRHDASDMAATASTVGSYFDGKCRRNAVSGRSTNLKN